MEPCDKAQPGSPALPSYAQPHGSTVLHRCKENAEKSNGNGNENSWGREGGGGAPLPQPAEAGAAEGWSPRAQPPRGAGRSPCGEI